MSDRDREVSDIVEAQQSRLRRFIRRRVPDPSDVEDILQEVFLELVEANRLLMPIEHVTGWLYRVARNRIIDLFRKKRPVRFGDLAGTSEEGGRREFEDLIPSPDAGPEALVLRGWLLEELEAAVSELPEAERDVFLAHELGGRSFRQMAAETGVSINTLLSRKRSAVRRLRERLEDVHDEWTKG